MKRRPTEFRRITKGKRGKGIANQSLFNKKAKGSKVKTFSKEEMEAMGYATSPESTNMRPAPIKLKGVLHEMRTGYMGVVTRGENQYKLVSMLEEDPVSKKMCYVVYYNGERVGSYYRNPHGKSDRSPLWVGRLDLGEKKINIAVWKNKNSHSVRE